MAKIRIKNVSKQNPLSIQLETRGPDGQFESRNLGPGEFCDLTKLQARSHQVKKLRAKGMLREIPIPVVKKEEPESESDAEKE